MSGTSSEKETKSYEAFRLGEFKFVMDANELLDPSGNPVRLRNQSLEILAYLLARNGKPVSKIDLFRDVWAGTAVTDDSLVQGIADIRRTLNDTDHTIIQTLPKRGYRINGAPISEGHAAGSADDRQPTFWNHKILWLAFACVAAVVTFGTAYFWYASESFDPVDPATMNLPLPSKPSIAVLAFDDFSLGDESDYLSDAIAEGVITELSRFPELFVIARNSSFSFRDAPTDVKEISRTLGVRYLLEGSQQKDGDRLRVTVQLIDAVEGHHLWAEVYERNLSDVFAVQDDIVRKVVATVAQKVMNFEGEKAKRSDESKLTALLHNLKARRHLFAFTPEGNEKARLANLAAIRADPTQPFGYVGLTFVHINRYRWGWTDLDPAEELRIAQEYARKAVELAPEFYDAHSAMAYVHIQEGNLDQAIARFQRALELNPNDTNAMATLAEALTYAGRADEAEELMLVTTRLDPLHQDWVKWNLAWVQWHTGNCDEALKTMKAMSEIPPLAYRVLAIIHMCLGQLDEAKKAVDRLIEFDPDYSLAEVRHNYEGKYRKQSDLDRVLSDLSGAGLPE